MGRASRAFDWAVRGSTAALVASLLAGMRSAAEGADLQSGWTPAAEYLAQAGILGLAGVLVAELVLVARRFAVRKQKGYAALTGLLGILVGAVAVTSLLRGG